MSLRIHIERLLLDGIPIGRHDARLIQAAVEAKLAELFEGDSGMPRINFDSALPHLRGANITLSTDFEPAAAGAQIARAVHSAIGEFSSIRSSRATPSVKFGNDLVETKPGVSKSNGKVR
jgi:hypothetical protein